MFPRAIRSALVDDCEKQVAIKVAKTASAVLPKPSSTDEEKADPYNCFLGSSWLKSPMRAASTHALCRSMKRGLANPATSRLATGFTAGIFEVWNAVGGEVGADAASWRPFVERKLLIKEASRQGWGETVAHL